MKVQVSESIPSLKSPSTKEFFQMWKQFQPFLIEGVAEHWDACNKWSNDYLIKHCGNNIVPVQFYKKSFLDDYHNFACEDGYDDRRKMKYQDYVKNHIEYRDIGNQNDYGLGCYIYQADFQECFPEIIGDLTYPVYLERKPLVSFWHGFSNQSFSSVTPLHFDGIHNIFIQIRGRKRIILFPPSNYLSFYPPLKDGNGYAEFSKVDPNLPDLELFPKFPWQEKIEILLQPGEMLYVPPFWWHHVTAVDENISLSFWYDVKIQDIFKQQNFLSTILNVAPHYLYYAISSPKALRDSMRLIKSLISQNKNSFTESLGQDIKINK